MPALSGRTALVTGASSGLGIDFARDLARRGADLVIVARREARLRDVKAELRADYGVAVDVMPYDLAEPDAPQRLFDAVASRWLDIDILVNNAGFGLFGPFVDGDWTRERDMLQVNLVALTHLTKLFVRPMVARGFGYVLQVASIGAYQPSPMYAAYAAAKSYVLHFGEALNVELRDTGVSCTVLSPGITATEFLRVAGQGASLYQRLAMMESADVTRIGIEAMLKRKPSVVPGLLNKLTTQSNRLIPRRLSAAIGHLLMTTG